MDADKDGIIGKNDLRATFDALGRMVSDKELDELLGEATGPLNFTMLLTLFANRMSGRNQINNLADELYGQIEEIYFTVKWTGNDQCIHTYAND